MHLNRFDIANHSNFHERCSLLAGRIQVGYNVHYLCSITTRKHGIDEIVNLPSPKAVYTLQDTCGRAVLGWIFQTTLAGVGTRRWQPKEIRPMISKTGDPVLPPDHAIIRRFIRAGRCGH